MDLSFGLRRYRTDESPRAAACVMVSHLKKGRERMKITRTASAFAATILLFLLGWAEARSAGSSKGQAFSAGEPGDPKKSARIVIITIAETDSKMMFTPAKVEVADDEQIRFVLRNHGRIDHEFVLLSPTEPHPQAGQMKQGLAGSNAMRLPPRTIGELVWKFTRPGQFEFACLIPGHREKGLLGTVMVR